jgi:peptidoglycan-associated lipoprotein
MNVRFILPFFASLLCVVGTQCASPNGAGSWGNAEGYGSTLDFQGLPQRQEGVSLYGPGSENVELHPVEPVYFAFDSSVISSSEQPKIDRLAQIAHQTLIIIAGHTDSTGTFEYNRALGERRAMAVRKALLQQGVSSGNLQTISYGEDMLTGQGDAFDRRAEFGALKGSAAP